MMMSFILRTRYSSGFTPDLPPTTDLCLSSVSSRSLMSSSGEDDAGGDSGLEPWSGFDAVMTTSWLCEGAFSRGLANEGLGRTVGGATTTSGAVSSSLLGAEDTRVRRAHT